MGIVAVRAGDHAADGDAVAVGEAGPGDPEFAPVNREFFGCFATAGRFGDLAVHGHISQVEAHDLVVAGQHDLFELVEDAGSDPLVAAVPDRGR